VSSIPLYQNRVSQGSELVWPQIQSFDYIFVALDTKYAAPSFITNMQLLTKVPQLVNEAANFRYRSRD
jgi:hypothetical protein